jgi:hypothetical protein
MIQVKMANDNLLDIFYLVASAFDLSVELMLWLVPDSREDVGYLRSPDRWVVLATPGLPQDKAFVGMLDQNTIHGKLSTLVDEGLVFVTLERGVSTANNETLICL